MYGLRDTVRYSALRLRSSPQVKILAATFPLTDSSFLLFVDLAPAGWYKNDRALLFRTDQKLASVYMDNQ